MAALAWLTGPHWAEFVFGKDSFLPGLLGTPLIPGDLLALEELGYAINLVLVLGLLLLAQWAFLRPGKGFTVRLAEQGRPLKSADRIDGAIFTLRSAGNF